MSEALMQIDGLSREFITDGGLFGRRARVWAVSNLDLQIRRGETFGLVGESGSGKSTLANLLVGLDTPSGGTVTFDGVKLDRRTWPALRRRIQVVFQDPQSSLDPRMTVLDTIMEPLRVGDVGTARSRRGAAVALARTVGLDPDSLARYPHEFSGGQRQRIAIARALVLRPDFLVLDEPTSALDVSIQAQVLELLKDLQVRFGLTYLFISHNMAVIRRMTDRVGVLYLGRLVEVGPTPDVFRAPRHPYTRALLDAVPRIRGGRRDLAVLSGEPPSPSNPPAGCGFHTRCPVATERCRSDLPILSALGTSGHSCACHLAGSAEEGRVEG